MKRPLALVLFCGAGGVDVGLERAGFDTIGIDWCPSQQPREKGQRMPDDATRHWTGAGELHMADLSTADAVEAAIRAFDPDFVAASPPCQAYSDATPTKNRAEHADLVASTREGILRTGVPAWIENVASRRVPFTGFWVMLCGSMFPELYHLKRHRRFELHGWRTQQPWHSTALCRYGSDAHDSAACELCADLGASDARRVAVAVAVAGNGPQGGLDGKREVLSVAGEGGGFSKHHERDARPTVTVTVTVTANANCDRGSGRGGQWAKTKAKRDVVSVIGTNGSTPAFGGDKEKRAAFRRGVVSVLGDGSAPGGWSAERARTCVGVFGKAMDWPGQLYGQNRAGPEAIRWRRAMAWLDGPKNRYALAQAIPPAYAEFLGREFLSRRST